MTPLTPTDWKMTFDGETVSLSPSVGNWQLACRSHYIVRRGQIIRAGNWTERQVAAAQARDKATKARYYRTTQQQVADGSISSPAPLSKVSIEDGSAPPPPKSLE
jgi:Family of unknown function (DUF6527)